MPPKLELYDAGTMDLYAGTDFGEVAAGGLSAEALIDLWNGRDGAPADDLLGASLRIVARDAGAVSWDGAHPVLVGGWLEARVTGNGDALPAYSSPWAPVAPGAPLTVPTIPAGTYREIGLRLRAPMGEPVAFEIGLEIDPAPVAYLAVPPGLQGVATEIGAAASYLVAGGGLDPLAPEGAGFAVEESVAVVDGLPVYVAGGDQVVDGDAADGALVAGEGYWITVEIGSAGLTLTKGNAGALPLDEALRADPVGGVLLGWVAVPFGLVVTAADVVSAEPAPGLFALSSAGLVATIGSGTGITSRSVVRWGTTSQAALSPSVTESVWLESSGAVVVSATRPAAGGIELYSVTTDGAGVTSSEDRRRLTPGAEPVVLRLDAPTAGGAVETVVPFRASLGPVPIEVQVTDNGGGASGQTIAGVEVWRGGAWVPLLTGTRRPSFAWDTATLSASVYPELYALEMGERIRLVADDVPVGGSPAALYAILNLQRR